MPPMPETELPLYLLLPEILFATSNPFGGVHVGCHLKEMQKSLLSQCLFIPVMCFGDTPEQET